MKRLLLISNSTQHGSGYLEHCAGQIKSFLGGVGRVLFVPYALDDLDGYAATARKAYEEMGFGLDSTHEAADPVAAVAEAEAMFIGGGNTFRLLDLLYQKRLVEPIRQRVLDGMPYMGASAGSNVACLSIKTTNDMPIVYPPTFDALALLPFNLNPHFLEPEPGSTHMGETRETRIREFHEMNETPVVAIREGAMLHVEGEKMTLRGRNGGVVFGAGQARVDYEPGADLSFLLRY